MASAGILQVEKDAAAKIEPLLTTTDQTQRIPIEQLEQKPPKIKEIAQNFEPSGKVMMLGARISGVVKSAFPDGPPKEEKKAEDAKEDEAKSAESKADVKDEAGKPDEADAGKENKTAAEAEKSETDQTAEEKDGEQKKPGTPHTTQPQDTNTALLSTHATITENSNNNT